ncbi:MAG: hypothetical protein H0U46_05175 [Actinobacteria bacterium]|nr:hypothetical protein [Actinomycetota bacterium]
MSEQLTRSLPASRPRIGFGTVLILALAASLVAWVLIDRNEQTASPMPAATPSAETPLSAEGPRIVTVDGLSALSGLRGRPVYWAGARPDAVYEVTEHADGRVYVRYLRSGTELGSLQPDFLTVATYPRPDAYADIEAAAKRPGAITVKLPAGLAVYDEARSTSVYLAYRGSTEQVEVYSPSAFEARRVVESGRVRPVP